MPLNIFPKGYIFTPIYNAAIAKPFITTYNHRYARLEAGGMFFRSREQGQSYNKITVEITNEKVIIRSNNSSPATISFKPINNPSTRRGKIDSIVPLKITTVPAANLSYILTITMTDEKTFTVSDNQSNTFGSGVIGSFFRCSSAVFRVIAGKSSFIAGDKFYIHFGPTIETFLLPAGNPGTPPDPLIPGDTGTSASGPTPAQVRAIIQSDIIEALAPGVDINYLVDGDSVSPFPETHLSGGNGLPINASGIANGPDRAFVFVNTGEDYSGVITPVNIVYEWVGNTATEGNWVDYKSR